MFKRFKEMFGKKENKMLVPAHFPNGSPVFAKVNNELNRRQDDIITIDSPLDDRGDCLVENGESLRDLTWEAIMENDKYEINSLDDSTQNQFYKMSLSIIIYATRMGKVLIETFEELPFNRFKPVDETITAQLYIKEAEPEFDIAYGLIGLWKEYFTEKMFDGHLPISDEAMLQYAKMFTSLGYRLTLANYRLYGTHL